MEGILAGMFEFEHSTLRAMPTSAVKRGLLYPRFSFNSKGKFKCST